MRQSPKTAQRGWPQKRDVCSLECPRKGAQFGRIFEPNACIRLEKLSFSNDRERVDFLPTR